MFLNDAYLTIAPLLGQAAAPPSTNGGRNTCQLTRDSRLQFNNLRATYLVGHPSTLPVEEITSSVRRPPSTPSQCCVPVNSSSACFQPLRTHNIIVFTLPCMPFTTPNNERPLSEIPMVLHANLPTLRCAPGTNSMGSKWLEVDPPLLQAH